jgi:TatD DNase family protein
MQYFDTHAHLGLIYDDPIEQLIVTQKPAKRGRAHRFDL